MRGKIRRLAATIKRLNGIVFHYELQVEYLFTDKTGTLTRNEMRFRMCSCNGTVYKELNDGQLYNTASSSVVSIVSVNFWMVGQSGWVQG
jgi:P-type E1-E2 ATPase